MNCPSHWLSVNRSDLLLGVRAIARVVGTIPRPSCENSSNQELDLGKLVSFQCKCSKNTGYFQSEFDDNEIIDLQEAPCSSGTPSSRLDSVSPAPSCTGTTWSMSGPNTSRPRFSSVSGSETNEDLDLGFQFLLCFVCNN